MRPAVAGTIRGGVWTLLLAVALTAATAAPEAGPLLEAARKGDVALVQALLREGTDPNVAQGDGLTALHVAAEAGRIEVARVLLEAGANVGAGTRIGAYTPLHLAAGGAHTSVVEALLRAGADPAAVTTTSGVTPLHMAAKAVDGAGAVKALIGAGAPLNVGERSAGQTALMFAAAAGRAESVRALLAAGADPGIATRSVDVMERMAIDRAAEGRLREAIAEARRQLGQTDGPLSPTGVQMALAAQREFVRSEEAVEEVLEGFHPDSLANMEPAWDTPAGFKAERQILARPQYETLVGMYGGMTALLHAAREGRIEAAEALLDGGADIDQQGASGETPLVMALLNGRFDLAIRLIERGADPNPATNTDGITALFAVLQTQWAWKFTDHPQPRAQDNAETDYLTILNALLEAGADPNARLKTHLWHSDFLRGKLGMDLTGATPFWRAALAQDVEAMKALVAHGADPNLPTVLPEYGMREGRQNDGRLQEDSGMPPLPPGTPNMYPIHAATGGGYMGLGAFMMNSVPNNFMNAVRYLVEEHGADVNLPDSWGYVPLHYASVRGGNDVIEYLVSKGADPKAVSRLGQSTADMARGGRAGYFSRPPYPQTVELLQSLGSELICLNTHFRGTGDYCPGSGVPPFDAEDQPGVIAPGAERPGGER